MKVLLQYLVLVGIPVLGVLGILQLGQGLTAPRSVSGSWQLSANQGEPPASEGSDCPAATDALAASALTIEQSGPRLVVEVGDLTAQGHIEGHTVRAESQRIDLTAQLETTGTMQGILSFPACHTTPSIAFSATPEEAS